MNADPHRQRLRPGLGSQHLMETQRRSDGIGRGRERREKTIPRMLQDLAPTLRANDGEQLIVPGQHRRIGRRAEAHFQRGRVDQISEQQNG
ncbi:MAG: hypothetical protein ABIP55_05745 [Tepidisphaeraceae bacterium]